MKAPDDPFVYEAGMAASRAIKASGDDGRVSYVEEAHRADAPARWVLFASTSLLEDALNHPEITQDTMADVSLTMLRDVLSAARRAHELATGGRAPGVDPNDPEVVAGFVAQQAVQAFRAHNNAFRGHIQILSSPVKAHHGILQSFILVRSPAGP